MAEVLRLPGVKQAYVVGLFWRHEGAVPSAKVLRARSLGYGNARWGAVLKLENGTTHVGFCEPINGVKWPSRVTPLAAIVAPVHPQPWMGCYQIGDDRYWYIAVRNGQEVVPEGDQVLTREELDRVRERHQAYGEWNLVEGTLQDLAEIARATSSRHAGLRDVRSTSRLMLGRGVAAFVVIAVGVGAWRWHVNQVEARRISQHAAQVAAFSRRIAQVADSPWVSQPRPSDLFTACASAWHAQSLATAGWTLASWNCKLQAYELSINTVWSRDGGIAADAPGVLAKDAQHANASRSIPVSFATHLSNIIPEADAKRAAWSLAQAYGLTLTLETAVMPAPLLSAAGSERAPRSDSWIKAPISFNLVSAPWLDFGKSFDAVPGLRVTNIGFDVAAQQWTTSGTLYALRSVGVPSRASTR